MDDSINASRVVKFRQHPSQWVINNRKLNNNNTNDHKFRQRRFFEFHRFETSGIVSQNFFFDTFFCATELVQ